MTEERQTFESALRDCMIEHGAILPNWRTKLIEINGNNNSDYRMVLVECYKPRYRHPYMSWNICVDIVRELVLWDYSTHEYL